MTVEIWVRRSCVRVRSLACVSFVLCGGQCGRCKDVAEAVGRTLLGRGLAFSGSVGCSGFAHDSQCLECSGEVWLHGELFLFLIKKEPFALTKAVEFRPSVAAETLKACALIGLHMIA